METFTAITAITAIVISLISVFYARSTQIKIMKLQFLLPQLSEISEFLVKTKHQLRNAQRSSLPFDDILGELLDFICQKKQVLSSRGYNDHRFLEEDGSRKDLEALVGHIIGLEDSINKDFRKLLS